MGSQALIIPPICNQEMVSEMVLVVTWRVNCAVFSVLCTLNVVCVFCVIHTILSVQYCALHNAQFTLQSLILSSVAVVVTVH